MSIDLYQRMKRSRGCAAEDERMIHPDLLGRIGLFQGLSRDLLDELAGSAMLRNLAPGEVVLEQGAGSKTLHALLSGRVKMFKSAPDGKEQTLFLFGPGEAFCLWTLFQEGPFPGTLAALEESRVIVIPGRDLERIASGRPELLRHFVAVLSKRLGHATRLVEALSLKGTDQRLAAFLLHQCSMGCPGPAAEVLELCITQRELAKMLGTTPENLSRVIRRLEDDGLVQGMGRTIRILDRRRLERLAAD
jgi:CRP/FNR family transcriptional regulator, dissimilatory nitrate respiration regulator